jgi:hypothetical protein
MYLDGNWLQCDCQLQEAWRWCEDRNIRTVYKGVVPKCDTPSEVSEMSWGVLEKGQCLDGNIQYNGDYNSTSLEGNIEYYGDYNSTRYNTLIKTKRIFNFFF